MLGSVARRLRSSTERRGRPSDHRIRVLRFLRSASAHGDLPVTPDQQSQLQAVNTDVNAIPYIDLPGAHEPADWWTDVPVAGNSWVCRDFVLAKADRLKALGWPPADLSVILCWTEPVDGQREYHAVLGVTVDGELWILDSRLPLPYLKSEPPLPYQWDRMQVAGTTEFEPLA